MAAIAPRGGLQLMFEQQRIESDIAANAARVQRAHGLRQFFDAEARLGARREVFQPEVDAIGARFDGRVQLRPVARRTLDFRLAR